MRYFFTLKLHDYRGVLGLAFFYWLTWFKINIIGVPSTSRGEQHTRRSSCDRGYKVTSIEMSLVPLHRQLLREGNIIASCYIQSSRRVY